MKKVKVSALRLMKAAGLFALTRRLNRGGVCVLGYHGCWLGSEGFNGDAMFMRAETFAGQLDRIRRLGYTVIPLAQAIDGLTGRAQTPKHAVVITIDDGWYSTYLHMLPALEARRLPATLFVDTDNLIAGSPVPHVMAGYLRRLAETGIAGRVPSAEERGELESRWSRLAQLDGPRPDRLEAARTVARAYGFDPAVYEANRVFGYMTPAELKDAGRRGLDIQLHTHTHELGDFGPTRIRDEIGENRRILSEILGRSPESFYALAYPHGDHHNAAKSALIDHGVRIATTLEPTLAQPGVDPLYTPRLVSGEQWGPVEFEAELAGVGVHIRRMLRRPRRGGRARAG